MINVFDSYLNAAEGFNDQYLYNIRASKDFLKKHLDDKTPEFLVVLGSGLGGLADDTDITDKQVVPYGDIPGFPPFRGVDGHAGELVIGRLSGKLVAMMSGRYHYYEYADLPLTVAMKLITFPTRVFQALGTPTMIVSNAAGGVNKNFKVGDVMIMDSHINMMGSNPLLGPNISELGVRFPPMTDAYDPYLSYLADQTASKAGFDLQHGIYVALTGPTYETPAEYHMIHSIGGDAVGMSTVPEVIAARHAHFDLKSPNTNNTNRMNVLGITVVTNLGGPEFTQSPSHEEVKQAGNKAMPKVIPVVKGVIKDYSGMIDQSYIDYCCTQTQNEYIQDAIRKLFTNYPDILLSSKRDRLLVKDDTIYVDGKSLDMTGGYLYTNQIYTALLQALGGLD